jgi:hypothetical protein
MMIRKESNNNRRGGKPHLRRQVVVGRQGRGGGGAARMVSSIVYVLCFFVVVWIFSWIILQYFLLFVITEGNGRGGGSITVSGSTPSGGSYSSNSRSSYYNFDTFSLLRNSASSAQQQQRRIDQCQIPISYANDDELHGRMYRFPSVEERIQVYMSNWYRVPCSTTTAATRTTRTTGKIPLRRIKTTDLSPYKASYYVVGETQQQQAHDEASSLSSAAAVATSPRQFRITNGTLPAQIFYVDPSTILQCANNTNVHNHMRFYCKDIHTTLFPLLLLRVQNNNIHNNRASIEDNDDTSKTSTTTIAPDWTWNDIPIFYQFGDATESRAQAALTVAATATVLNETAPSSPLLLSQPRIPHLKKFRLAMHRKELQRVSMQSENPQFVWIHSYSSMAKQGTTEVGGSGTSHHNNLHVDNVVKDCIATTSMKVPKTIRGAERLQPIIWKLNIKRHYGYLYQVSCADTVPWTQKQDKAIFRGKLNGDLKRATESVDKTDLQRCMMLDRCKLVWKYHNSTWIDARLTSTMNVIPNVLEGGTDVTAPKLSMQEMFSYKGIIILEGNDVSSGLKNALLSSSVVLMPQPLYTSWAMEELLEPWIHYIPLKSDLSDVESKVQWMLSHDAEARRISYRASLWIKDLVFHPQASVDETIIMTNMLDRYSQHFELIT